MTCLLLCVTAARLITSHHVSLKTHSEAHEDFYGQREREREVGVKHTPQKSNFIRMNFSFLRFNSDVSTHFILDIKVSDYVDLLTG